jgi:hypothetical protein
MRRTGIAKETKLICLKEVNYEENEGGNQIQKKKEKKNRYLIPVLQAQ